MSSKYKSAEIKKVISPPIWDSYYYVSSLTRKAYEKAIPPYLKEGDKYKILDYGCGVKPYEYIFENYIEQYVGIDVGTNPNADIIIQPGENLNYKNDYFDFIISSQVLEHVENVEQYMNECFRVLKKGGYVFLSTHGTWQYHASPYDFNRWTYIGLKNLLEKHNFEVIEYIPILGQLALTSQLRLSFYNSFANMIGIIGKLLLAPISFIYQFKMMLEDALTPKRVKKRDSAIFLFIAKKK
jgi:SAM-dependent methyltransferase